MGRVPRVRGRHHAGRAPDLDAGGARAGASAAATSTAISASTTRPTPSAPSPTAASTSRSADTPFCLLQSGPWLHLEQTGRWGAGPGGPRCCHTPWSSWGAWTCSVGVLLMVAVGAVSAAVAVEVTRRRAAAHRQRPPIRHEAVQTARRRRRSPRCGPTPASSATRPCGRRSSRRPSSSASSSAPPPNRSASSRRPSWRRRRTSSMPGSTRSTRRCAPSSRRSARWSPALGEAERSEVRAGRPVAAQPRRDHRAPERVGTVAPRGAGVSPTARGQWGERMAEDVLRLAGFVENVNYVKQTQVEGGTGRPDFTFPLPEGPRALHGRQVPDGRVPALPRSAAPTPSARRTARRSCATSGCA